MRLILDNTSDYILVIDKLGKIKFCNEKLLLKLNIEGLEIINNRLGSIININETNTEAKILNTIKGEKKNIDLNILYKSKDTITLNCNILIDEFENEESIFIIGEELTNKFYSKDDLETLLDSFPFGVWIKDLDGNYKFINESYAGHCKSEKMDMLGKPVNQFWNKGASSVFSEMDNKVIKSRTPMIFNEKIGQNEDKKCYETFKAPIFDENENLKYTVGYSRNITIENKLKEEMTQNKDILQIKNMLNKPDVNINYSEAMNNICKELYKYTNCDSINLFSYNEKSSILKNIFNYGIVKRDDISYHIGDGLLNKRLYERDYEGIKHIDEVKHKPFRDILISQNVNFVGIYKIMYEEEVLGIIQTKYFGDNKFKINIDDTIKSVCSIIGLYIKNVSLAKEVKDELTIRTEVEKDLEDFLEISVDLVGKFNLDGDILMANSQCESSLGWSEEELVKMNMMDILGRENTKGNFKNMLEYYKSSKRGTTRIKNKNGEYRDFEWNYKYIKEKQYVLATARDITDKLANEENKRKLEDAVKLESFKNEFFANISHELRTPLNIILGSVQLINKKNEKNPIEYNCSCNSYVQSIRQNSYRLLRLVNNLIDITRIDTGFYELVPGNYNIVNIVENIALSVAQYVEYKGINLIFDTNSEEQVISCDPDKIERIVLNLLSNAIKYTSEDGNILVCLDVKDDKVEISIEDNGIGIASDKLESIFERFKQVDNILTRKHEGSGIGLSLVKSLVELHNGKIYVSSEVNKGTKFTFELPIVLVENNEQNLLYNCSEEMIQIEKCNIEFSDIYI